MAIDASPTLGSAPGADGARAEVATKPGRREAEQIGRSAVSELERSRPSFKLGLNVLTVVVLGMLVIVCGAPLLWLAKSSVSTTEDIVQRPFELWPSGIQWHNLAQAWSRLKVGQYLLNTLWLALGSWFFGLFVALTGGFGIAILKPRYAKAVNAAVLATLFIPAVVSLIPLYLTILDMPLINLNLINTFWAVWLPSAAGAFNLLLVTRFFSQLPNEIIEAARIDGVSNFQLFYAIVLPMSKPIIAVVSLLTVVAAWKEFLWPLLVLSKSELQPLSVGLYLMAEAAPPSLLLAAMFISVIIPVLLFLVFQRYFLRSAGNLGAVKG